MDVHDNTAASPREYPVFVRDIIISDPHVLAVKETQRYYIYAQTFSTQQFPEITGKPAFYAMESPDLIHWSRPITVFEKPDDFWADLDYWAPECHEYNGRFYLFSSFRANGRFRACQCLVADSPLGPFKALSDTPLTPPNWQCLDGTLFIDDKRRPWLVFCHEWMQVYDGQICALQLSDDLSRAVSGPEILFRASDAPWALDITDGKGGQVTDGPWLHRMKDGTLIMLWSGFSAGGYTVSCATSRSGGIHGPWIQDRSPLFALDGGHPSLFRTFGGKLMMAMHCPNIHTKKRMHLFEMEEDGSRLRIINEFTGNWYDCIDGNLVQGFKYNVKTTEEPVFTHLK